MNILKNIYWIILLNAKCWPKISATDTEHNYVLPLVKANLYFLFYLYDLGCFFTVFCWASQISFYLLDYIPLPQSGFILITCFTSSVRSGPGLWLSSALTSSFPAVMFCQATRHDTHSKTNTNKNLSTWMRSLPNSGTQDP